MIWTIIIKIPAGTNLPPGEEGRNKANDGRCFGGELLPHPASTNLALLANVEQPATVRTVPLCRPSRDVRQAHALQMKPLLLAILSKSQASQHAILFSPPK
jgi:hypothetical protein